MIIKYLRLPNLYVFVAFSFLFFLISLNLSVLLLPFNITFSLALIALVAVSLSWIFCKYMFIHLKESTLVLLFFILMLVANISHFTSFYLAVPIGFNADQRIPFIDEIANTGSMTISGSNEPLYYSQYPISWLISSVFKITTAMDSSLSLLLTCLTAYVCMLSFLWLILRSVNKNALITITTLATVLSVAIYLHRPFQDALASSFGALALVIVVYLIVKQGKASVAILFLTFPLLIAHGLSIYFAVLSLLVVSLSFFLTKAVNFSKRALNFAVIIFGGTWGYQLGSEVFDSLTKQVPIRFDQLTSVLSPDFFVNSISQSLIEQQAHYVYPFDPFVTFLSLGFLPLLVSVGVIYFLFKLVKNKNSISLTLFLIGCMCLIFYSISFIFAYKGIENFVPRYFLVYTVPLSVIVVVKFLSEIRTVLPKLSSLILIFTLIAGCIVATESFYTPYGSLINTPDSNKLNILYELYYGPSMVNEYNNDTFFILTAPNSADNLTLYPSLTYTGQNTSIIYDNGFVIATQ